MPEVLVTTRTFFGFFPFFFSSLALVIVQVYSPKLLLSFFRFSSIIQNNSNSIYNLDFYSPHRNSRLVSSEPATRQRKDAEESGTQISIGGAFEETVWQGLVLSSGSEYADEDRQFPKFLGQQDQRGFKNLNSGVFYFINIEVNMSSFSKSSHGRQLPFSSLSLNQNYQFFSATNTPLSKTQSTLFSKPEKHTKETTDLKKFKEKYNINDENPPISCLRLIKTHTPKMFISLDDLNKVNFPAVSYSISDLINFSRLILDSSPERRIIAKSFNTTKLIQLLAENYNVVAYHNFTHAFSLLLLLYQAYNRCDKLKKMLTEKQWFYVFIAALAHDLRHPGTTNAFEIKAKTDLAKEANNVSVLQKMHLNQLWTILRKNSQVNFLQGYASYESAHIKHVITKMILSTDFASHFKDLEALRKITAKPETPEGKNAMFVVQQLFHACDIGNPCLDFENYMNWSSLVTFEFNQIAEEQKRRGLQVTTMLKYTNIKGFYKGQVGFCKGLVLPLWKELEVVFPGIYELTGNIHSNISELQRKAKDEQHCELIESGHF